MALDYSPRILPPEELYERFGEADAGQDGEKAVLALAGGSSGARDKVLAAIRDAEGLALSYLRRADISISEPSQAPNELKANVADHVIHILYARRPKGDLPGHVKSFRKSAFDFYAAVANGEVRLEGVQAQGAEATIVASKDGHQPYSNGGLDDFLNCR